jgi:hypothetical protein
MTATSVRCDVQFQSSTTRSSHVPAFTTSAEAVIAVIILCCAELEREDKRLFRVLWLVKYNSYQACRSWVPVSYIEIQQTKE